MAAVTSWHATYLLVNLFTIAGPLARSFEPRIRFYRHLPALAAAIGVTGAPFIAWDVLYTYLGVWGFNPMHLSGLRLLGLPVEEWLFFITVPYACVFSYDVLNHFLPRTWLTPVARPLALALGAVLVIAAAVHPTKAYTASAFGLNGLTLLALGLWVRPWYLGHFFRAYLVTLVPFFLVNGILTGSFIPEEVVWYNDAHNLGIRLGTIPLEDTMYGMLLLLGNTVLFEVFRGRHGRHAPTTA